jgi:hypothetical protein
MSSTATLLRRTAFILSIAAVLGALMAWRRDRLGPGAPDSPPEWPEFTSSATPEPNGAVPTPATPAAKPEVAEAGTWMPPLDDGSCPPDYPVKVKESSGIFHVPGGRFYERTNPDRCYATASAAEVDGFRQSKS